MNTKPTYSRLTDTNFEALRREINMLMDEPTWDDILLAERLQDAVGPRFPEIIYGFGSPFGLRVLLAALGRDDLVEPHIVAIITPRQLSIARERIAV